MAGRHSLSTKVVCTIFHLIIGIVLLCSKTFMPEHVENFYTFYPPKTQHLTRDHQRKIVKTNMSDDAVPVNKSSKVYIFYNRVPKCGSSVVFSILANSSVHLNCNRSRVYREMNITIEEQHKFVQEIMNMKTPLLYDRHLHFINFSRFNAAQPLYINVVRDPLERLVSFHYYRQNGFAGFKYKPNLNQTSWDMTYDDCVKEHLAVCMDPSAYFGIIPFFCGQDSYCREPGERSLIQAKHNLLRHYTLVGLAEHLKKFFVALGKKLPEFFANASVVYEKQKQRLAMKYKTKSRRPCTPETKAIMMPKLKEEYEFYYLARQNFFSIYKGYNTSSI